MSVTHICPGCGDTFDSKAGLSGHKASCPEWTEGMEPNDQTTDADTTENTMSDNQRTEEAELREQISEFLPGSSPLDGLAVRRIGYARYQVLSTRNDSLTVHDINLTEPSCTCEDWAYNLEDGEREICAHYALAFASAPDIDVSDLAVNTITEAHRELRDARQEFDAMMHAANGAAVESRAVQADSQADTLDPDAIVDSLRDAFEEDGFEVRQCEIDDEEVAFDLAHDDFDRLKEVTSQADAVGYDGETNRIALGDVDDYIEQEL